MRKYIEAIRQLNESDMDVVGAVARILKIDRLEAEKKLGDLPLMDAATVADAVAQKNDAEIMRLMGSNLQEQTVTLNIPDSMKTASGADKDDKGTITHGGPQAGDKKAPEDKKPGEITRSQGSVGPISETFKPGQEVIVGKRNGTISGTTDAPSDSIGVLFDGEFELVKKAHVKHKVEEMIAISIQPVEQSESLSNVYAALDQLESHIRNISAGELAGVLKRMEKLHTSLFENVGRKRK